MKNFLSQTTTIDTGVVEELVLVIQCLNYLVKGTG